jgi:hypothetical protein
MSGYLSAGLWTAEVTHDYLLCLPAVIPAVFLGRVINRRLSMQTFSKYIYVALAVIGLALLAQSLTPLR